MTELTYSVPKLEDLWFREELMLDEETMSYNIGYPAFKGYNTLTGTIEFPKENWQSWYATWVAQPELRFYAYLQRKSDKKFVGEINYHYSPTEKVAMIGIIIKAEFRGHGYAKEGLKLLCQIAKEHGLSELANEFPKERASALNLHKALGFVEVAGRGEDCFLIKEL